MGLRKWLMEKRAGPGIRSPFLCVCVCVSVDLLLYTYPYTHMHLHARAHTHTPTHAEAFFPFPEQKAQQGLASIFLSQKLLKQSRSAIRKLTRVRKREQGNWPTVFWAEAQSLSCSPLPFSPPPPPTFLNLKAGIVN